jgi:hypothetical protein
LANSIKTFLKEVEKSQKCKAICLLFVAACLIDAYQDLQKCTASSGFSEIFLKRLDEAPE